MGLFKSIFRYDVGKHLSKKPPVAFGVGYTLLGELSDVSSNINSFNKSKNKLVRDISKFAINNLELFDDDYLREFNYITDLIDMSDFTNYKNIEPKVMKFIKEADFHCYVTSTAKSIIDQLEEVSDDIKSKLPENFGKELNDRYEEIRHCRNPQDSIELFDKYTEFLENNKIGIGNKEEKKKELLDLLNE